MDKLRFTFRKNETFSQLFSWIIGLIPQIFTGRKRIFRRICFYRCGGDGIPACIAGGISACLAAGLEGGGYPSMPCRFPGKFRGIWPGGGGGPGPHPRGKLRGIWLEQGCLLWGGGCLLRGGGCGDPLCDGYCCGRYASYWNAFLFFVDNPRVYRKASGPALLNLKFE